MAVILDYFRGGVPKEVIRGVPKGGPYNYEMKVQIEKETPWDIWLNTSFIKIALGCESEEELIELYQKAKDLNIPCTLIEDLGFTEFKGELTKTAVAIGPFWAEDIDKITGTLTLL